MKTLSPQARKRWRAVLAASVPLCAALLLSRSAAGEHFDILLRAQAGDKQAEAFMDTTPPIGGVNPRPVLHVKAGETVKVTWQMKNGSPHGLQKNVTIHFFVVKEAQIGQKPVPDPAGQAGLVDNSFVMDFAPKAAATGALKLKMTDTGNYLVRVQSENTHQVSDHEHFSAIDVVVE